MRALSGVGRQALVVTLRQQARGFSVASSSIHDAASAQITLNMHPQVAQAVVTEKPGGGGLRVSVLPTQRITWPGLPHRAGDALFESSQLGSDDIRAFLLEKGLSAEQEADIELVQNEEDLPISSHKRVVLRDLLRGLFRSVDANADGEITITEFKDFVKDLGLERGDQDYMEMFLQYDADRSCKLNYEQFKALLLGTKLLSVGDVSGDGVATEFHVDEALMDFVVGHMFKKADVDGDGRISGDEVGGLLEAYKVGKKECAAKVFADYDNDADGKIDQKEFAALLLGEGLVGGKAEEAASVGGKWCTIL